MRSRRATPAGGPWRAAVLPDVLGTPATGHRPSPGGRLGPSCLSQWWPATFTVDGLTYGSSEHYMMTAKARLFGALATAEDIMAAPTPADAKSLGRQVAGFDEQVWVAHRYDIVLAASLAKFGQDPGLHAYLIGTTGRIPVEASPDDRVWGIGLAVADVRARRPSRWRGLNLLGFALMDARTTLSAGDM